MAPRCKGTGSNWTTYYAAIITTFDATLNATIYAALQPTLISTINATILSTNK
jgi:hypothetical protein